MAVLAITDGFVLSKRNGKLMVKQVYKTYFVTGFFTVGVKGMVDIVCGPEKSLVASFPIHILTIPPSQAPTMKMKDMTPLKNAAVRHPKPPTLNPKP